MLLSTSVQLEHFVSINHSIPVTNENTVEVPKLQRRLDDKIDQERDKITGRNEDRVNFRFFDRVKDRVKDHAFLILISITPKIE